MDRLSELPDDVIFHIISFLPFKSSVITTSILAKRWRLMWANVPGVGFTCNERCRCMQQINDNLNIFHRGSSTNQNHDFESWISTMFARRRDHIRNLVISPMNYQLKLPPSLFSSETLVYLRIFDCHGFIPDGVAVHFPALKELQLINVGYESPPSLRLLLSGCPVIEELTIRRMKALCCDICVAPNLTRFVGDIDDVFYVCLLTPKLRYLRLCVHKAKAIFASPLDSLIEADVDLLYESNYYYSLFVMEFVAGLCNVTCLSLSTRQMEVPDSLFYDLVVGFHNLIKLNLRADWRFITMLLENADNLQVLALLPCRVGHNSTPYWMEPKQVPKCLVSCLETLNLVEFEWSTEDEFDMVKYILKNAQVLKKMKIVFPRDFKVKFEAAIGRVAMLEIGSLRCHVAFVPKILS